MIKLVLFLAAAWLLYKVLKPGGRRSPAGRLGDLWKGSGERAGSRLDRSRIVDAEFEEIEEDADTERAQ